MFPKNVLKVTESRQTAWQSVRMVTSNFEQMTASFKTASKNFGTDDIKR